jgi:hypothetical protein
MKYLVYILSILVTCVFSLKEENTINVINENNYSYLNMDEHNALNSIFHKFQHGIITNTAKDYKKQTHNEKMNFMIPLYNGKSYELEMEKHMNFVKAGYKELVLDENHNILSKNRDVRNYNCFYRGNIVNDPNSFVYISACKEYVHGYMQSEKHTNGKRVHFNQFQLILIL